MSLIHTIILGIVEGLTEFLPISSTAHLEITQTLLKIPTTDFIKSFEIAIQLGAIGAVIFLYKNKLLSSWIYFRNIIIAFIPTALIGFALYKIIKNILFGNILLAASMLFVGGIVIIFYEYKAKRAIPKEIDVKTAETLSVKELLIIGCAQALAVVPGVSRSGAVIISGRILGIPKKIITEFSFLLAIPTMLAATAYDLLKSGFSFSAGEWGSVGLGFLVSFVTAFFVVKWLIGYIKTHNFTLFGYYRIIFAILVFWLLIF